MKNQNYDFNDQIIINLIINIHYIINFNDLITITFYIINKSKKIYI